jgi:hypothetical protein
MIDEKRCKELETELEKLDSEINEQENKWCEEHPLTDRKNLLKHVQEMALHVKPLRKKYAELDREQRMIMPYTLSDIDPDCGNVMSLEEFISHVNSGGFIDYDGYGNYVKDGRRTDIEIYPSDVKHGSIRSEEFDTIIWYNR